MTSCQGQLITMSNNKRDPKNTTIVGGWTNKRFQPLIHQHSYSGQCLGLDLTSAIKQISHQLGEVLELLTLTLL